MLGISHSSGTQNTEVVHRRRGSAIHDEQERGESVVEFSNAHSSRHWSSGDFSDCRGTSEYATDRDAESIASESTQDEAVFDKKVLVKRSQGVGADGTERFRTEVTTTKTSKETIKH
uniref:Uncharacterized protein n=1 Tax=Steinernema glaseri TaxID=37863 RepID=A0A1I7YSM0_9BILA